jgi:hypothetical protein
MNALIKITISSLALLMVACSHYSTSRYSAYGTGNGYYYPSSGNYSSGNPAYYPGYGSPGYVYSRPGYYQNRNYYPRQQAPVYVYREGRQVNQYQTNQYNINRYNTRQNNTTQNNSYYWNRTNINNNQQINNNRQNNYNNRILPGPAYNAHHNNDKHDDHGWHGNNPNRNNDWQNRNKGRDHDRPYVNVNNGQNNQNRPQPIVNRPVQNQPGVINMPPQRSTHWNPQPNRQSAPGQVNIDKRQYRNDRPGPEQRQVNRSSPPGAVSQPGNPNEARRRMEERRQNIMSRR